MGPSRHAKLGTIIVSAFIASATSSAAQPPASALAEPTLLLDYPADSTVYDFRPTVNAEGTHVVFERHFPGEETRLFLSDLRYRRPTQLVDFPSARANWCWRHGATDDGKLIWGSDTGLYVIDPFNPGTPTPLPNTQQLAYPSWAPSCTSVAAVKNGGLAQGPATVRVDIPAGTIGPRLASGNKTWAGFMDINKTAQNLIVFAGQPISTPPYQENFNYVYLADTSTNPVTVRPLDMKAPTDRYSGRYQGRAPSWSPDGKWVVFESNRACQNPNLYALFLQDNLGANPAVQVTDCKYNAQHARFMPKTPGSGAVNLITAVALHPKCNAPGTYLPICTTSNYTNSAYANANGLAAVEVTKFVNPPSAP